MSHLLSVNQAIGGNTGLWASSGLALSTYRWRNLIACCILEQSSVLLVGAYHKDRFQSSLIAGHYFCRVYLSSVEIYLFPLQFVCLD